MCKRDASSPLKPPGLVFLQRRCRKTERGFAASGLSIEGVDQNITRVASVPLTDDPWQPVGEGEVIAIANGRQIDSVLAMTAGYGAMSMHPDMFDGNVG